ncbi:MAG: HlyD family efflux transporter periplasmic adaptor subunit [Thiogranum sp.]
MSHHGNSPHWYRVAGLRPRLVPHADLQRHTLRGQVWHVLLNRVSGRSYRFSGNAHHFIALMDGQRTVEDLWQANGDSLGDEGLTQEEAVGLLRRLYSADLLQTDTSTDAAEIFDRQQRQAHAKWIGRIKNPLAVKVPLFDPDRTLERLLPIFRPLFGRMGLVLWLAVLAVGAVMAALHWPEIVSDTSTSLLSPQNLALLWLCYPLIKALHELGHGLATKVWGGEVHEVGVILLALIPVPYVDASAAGTFPEKQRRMVVGAAGMMVELFLAVLALWLWLNTEPGLIHSLAYNTLLIGSVSTLFFNGNPLLRFDGYYVMTDAIGMPNLATRSNNYLGYLVKRYLFGVRSLESPTTADGERRWLIGYGVLSYIYRVIILVTIVLFVAESYPGFGVLIALWATATMLVLPVVKHIRVLLTSPELQRQHARAVSISVGLSLSAVALLLMVPAPLATLAEGVIAPPEGAELRAGHEGTIMRLLAQPDTRVERDQPLIETEDPFLQARTQNLQARLRELSIRRQVLLAEQKQVEANILDEEIQVVQGDLDRSREQAGSLLLRSPVDGVFLVDLPDDLPGRFVRRGDLLGYVADLGEPTVRVAVPQADIGLVKHQTRSVSVRLAEQLVSPVAANVIRQVPAAVERLPSAVLGPMGGGPFAVDPEDSSGTRAMEGVFEVVLALPVPVDRLGMRVYVRFDHGSEPLAQQWYRRLRQLFLSKFNV